jgi:2-polyprenyl-3-methyl-5-hydroxy-6-metoxy-1,4-benzoquinol methylase
MRLPDWTTRPGQDLNNQGHWNTKWLTEGKDTWRQYPVLFGEVIKLIRPHTRVMDLGCGNGVFLGRLDKEREGMELMGVDISTVAIVQLKKFYGIDGIVSRLPEIPYPIQPDYYDYVTILDTLEHIPDEREAMNNAFRILKPGGIIIIAVPEDHSEDYKEYIRTLDSEHVRWYDMGRVVRALMYYGKNPQVSIVDDPNLNKAYLGVATK